MFVSAFYCLISVCFLRSSEVFFNHVTGELQEAHSIFKGMRVGQESGVEKCRGSVLALDLPASLNSTGMQAGSLYAE